MCKLECKAGSRVYEDWPVYSEFAASPQHVSAQGAHPAGANSCRSS